MKISRNGSPKVVTVFGAESTGKTTLSFQMAYELSCPWVYEYARSYLEAMGSELTTDKMHDIARGQTQIQEDATKLSCDFIVHDTDLYSTIGYWDFWDGQTPDYLKDSAEYFKSDLYIICPSNIPFEANELRYGGDMRESTDDYWISVCEKYDLNYRVLTESNRGRRLQEALALASRM